MVVLSLLSLSLPLSLSFLSPKKKFTEKYQTKYKILLSKNQHVNDSIDNNTFGPAQHKPTSSSDTPLSTSASSHHRGDGSTLRQSRSKERRKRRGRDEMDVAHDDDPFAGMLHSQKRKRVDATLPGYDESMSNATPVSMETEDISEEVQRRLRIKEEQRKKRNAKPEKRKRDSLASNGSTSSPGTASRPRKKPKASPRDEGTNIDTAGTSGNRTRRFDRISDPDPTLLHGAKRQKQIAGLDAI